MDKAAKGMTTKVPYLLMIGQTLLIAILVSSVALPTMAQYKGKQLTESGSINSAEHKIDIPANWNKKLVVYAHGYIDVNGPSYFSSSDSTTANIFLQKGLPSSDLLTAGKVWPRHKA